MFIAPSSAIIKKYKISPDKVDICDVKKTYRLDEFTYKNKYFHILVSHSTLFTEIVEVDSNGSIIDSIGKLVGSNKPFTVIEYKDSSITACVNNIKNVIKLIARFFTYYYKYV